MSDFTQQLDEMKDCTVVTNDYLEKVNKALDELKRVRAVNAQLREASLKLQKAIWAYGVGDEVDRAMSDLSEARRVAAEGES